MGFIKNNHFMTTILILFLILSLSSFQQVSSMRPLSEEKWLNKNLLIQSLQRGPVPPSSSNPCTFIPGRGRGRCTLAENEVNFASGSMAHTPPAFPEVMVSFGAASKV